MKSCKDVQMGGLSWRVLMTQCLCSGGLLAGGHPAPAVSPKPVDHSSQHGPEDTLVLSTLAVQHPQLTCLDALPYPAWVQLKTPGSLHMLAGHEEAHSTFSSTFHVLCASKDNVAKYIRETRSVHISKGRNTCVFFSW